MMLSSFESKFIEQREEILKQISKTTTELDIKIQKEKNEMVLERQRMKLEMEMEYGEMMSYQILVTDFRETCK